MNAQLAELIGGILLLLIIRGVFKAGKSVLKDVLKDAIFVLVWRHFTGAHYHGNKMTDAGWWSHASDTKRHEFEQGTFIDRWEHKPRGHRMLWRWACTFAFIGLAYGLIADFWLTVHALMSLGVYGLVTLGFVIEAAIMVRAHARAILNPCSKSIAKILKLSPHAVKKMIHIDPENITDDGEIGWMGPFPDHLTPADEQWSNIERVFDTHLPVDTEFIKKFQQSPRIGVIMAAQKPPDRVMWAEMLAEMATCAAGEVVLGRTGQLIEGTRDRATYRASLTDLDDPHWGFDVNTKYGKSNFLGITAVQILHQDPQAQVIAIDPKRSSLIDFLGDAHDASRPLLPGVTMANEPDDPEAMWAAIQKARAILTRRSAKYKLDRTRKFPCVLIILDELNQFHTLMKGMWNKMKFDDSRLPKDERQGLAGPWPGWDDIYDILQMGRFVNMHFLVCSQDFRDEVFGGRGGRNFLGFKGMAGFNPGQWDKFMQTKPVPVMQNHAGRWIFSDGNPGNDQWVQVTFANAEHDRSAYDYAAEGRDAFVDNDGEDVTLGDAEAAALPTDHETLGLPYYLSSLTDPSVSHDEPATDSRRKICGEQAAADYFGWKLTRFQSARRRSEIPGEFRIGRTPVWYEEDLMAWERNRPGNSRKAKLRIVKDEDTA